MNGKDIPLQRIPLQGYNGTGKHFLEPKEEPYEVSFKQGEVPPEEEPLGKDVFDGIVTFTEDGKLLFDWKTLNLEGHEGVYSTTYQELIKSTLLFVHKDGTAKRVVGEQFTVKTKRTQIKGDKDGVEILCIIPVTDDGFLIGTYEDGHKKCVKLVSASGSVSFQGITGGGMRVFYTPKHKLKSVEYVENTNLPVLSFASQPKIYEDAPTEEVPPGETPSEASEYITIGVDGFNCMICGDSIGANDPVAVCPDCGGIICKSCAENGGLEDHDCEPEEEE